MRITRFTNFDGLTPFADDWERLASGSPFRSWTWLSNWWRHYGPGNRLAVLGVFDDSNTLAGIAPWYLERSTLHGRVLRMLGSGEVCSDYLSVLCRPGSDEAIVETLAEYLVAAVDDGPEPLRWDLLELDGVDAEDRPVAHLVDALAALGCTVHRRPGLNCWRLDLPVDWNSYVATLGKTMRRDLRRMQRDLLNTNRAVFHSVAQLDELPQAMAFLTELHQRRWNLLGEKGCFASDRFLGFYNDVVPELFRRGQAHIHWLELDGRPVATEYQLVGNGTVYAYQAGMDPDAIEQQPGKLINLCILREAINQGYLAFDFLRGDESYKARFGARPRPSVQFRVVPRRTVARMRHNLWMAGRNVKQWIKKGIRNTESVVPSPSTNLRSVPGGLG